MAADEFENLTRRYWNAWGDALRSTTTSNAADLSGWNEAIDWWTRLARGGAEQGDEAVARFGTQAQGWFGQMQQLAARFAGQAASPADIAAAWKQTLGGDAANPFAQMLGAMPGSAQTDPSAWFDQLMPWLQSWQRDGRSWLGLPAFGFAREHQERWQQLAQAQLDLQEQSQAYQTLLAEAGQEAFARFERKLSEHSQPGRQLDSVRALFDLWIDAAEDAYAEIALSPRFRDAYAALVNAQMTLRGRMQKEIEQVSAALGVPTRTELDAAHRKIVQLERELRRMREAMSAHVDPAAPRAAAPAPAREATPPRAPRTAAAKPRTSTKPQAKAKTGKPAAKSAKPAPRKSAAKAVKKTVSKAAKRAR